MFSKSKEKEVKRQVPTQSGGQRNVLAHGTKIIGEVVSDGDFRIDGFIEGSINAKGRVVIGKEGKVKGQITCANAEVEGCLSGTIVVDELLSLKSTAKVSGEVTIGKLAVEAGAKFDAKCVMSKNINTPPVANNVDKKKAVKMK